MSKYNSVHTGPNQEFGGKRLGLFKNTYQSLIAARVAKPEIPPMVNGPIKQANKIGTENFDFIVSV
jgi:hypothetical protein